MSKRRKSDRLVLILDQDIDHASELKSIASDHGFDAEIATDVGFGHLGRFSGNYRALYGEMPSTTLRTPTLCAA